MKRVRPGWFHVSIADHGEEFTFEPRPPRGPSLNEDRTTPRVSVCEDVGGCLRGITTLKLPEYAYVYRLHGKPRGIDFDTPWKVVPDWEETNEVWLRNPNLFRRVGRIDIEARILGEPEIRWRWHPSGNWQTAKE